jgi:hypothetical protein
MGTDEQRKISRSIIITTGHSTLTIRTFLFSPPLSAPPPACTVNFCDFFSKFTGPVAHGDRGALHCHWNACATKHLGLVRASTRGILLEFEEQSRARGGQNGGGLNFIASNMTRRTHDHAQPPWQPLENTMRMVGDFFLLRFGGGKGKWARHHIFHTHTTLKQRNTHGASHGHGDPGTGKGPPGSGRARDLSPKTS